MPSCEWWNGSGILLSEFRPFAYVIKIKYVWHGCLESLIKIQLKWKRTVEYYVMRKAKKKEEGIIGLLTMVNLVPLCFGVLPWFCVKADAYLHVCMYMWIKAVRRTLRHISIYLVRSKPNGHLQKNGRRKKNSWSSHSRYRSASTNYKCLCSLLTQACRENASEVMWIQTNCSVRTLDRATGLSTFA